MVHHFCRLVFNRHILLSRCHGSILSVQPFTGLAAHIQQIAYLHFGAPLVLDVQKPVHEPLHVLHRRFHLPAVDLFNHGPGLDGVAYQGLLQALVLGDVVCFTDGTTEVVYFN